MMLCHSSNGTTHFLLSPHELLEILATLVPPPRLNLIRYHGILAPNARVSKIIAALTEPASIRSYLVGLRNLAKKFRCTHSHGTSTSFGIHSPMIKPRKSGRSLR